MDITKIRELIDLKYNKLSAEDFLVKYPDASLNDYVLYLKEYKLSKSELDKDFSNKIISMIGRCFLSVDKYIDLHVGNTLSIVKIKNVEVDSKNEHSTYYTISYDEVRITNKSSFFYQIEKEIDRYQMDCFAKAIKKEISSAEFESVKQRVISDIKERDKIIKKFKNENSFIL